jgi:chromosome segregation ATPase
MTALANSPVLSSKPPRREPARPATPDHEECEKLLEEKSEVIRQLHRTIDELKAQVHNREEPPSAPSGEAEDLIALTEELEKERRQLKEDEAALTKQMREMEVQMSRERAELARQRNELKRLQEEIRHEVEMASREGELRSRLQPLFRRHEEAMHSNGRSAAPALLRSSPSVDDTPPPRPRDSGLFRRIFGAG